MVQKVVPKSGPKSRSKKGSNRCLSISDFRLIAFVCISVDSKKSKNLLKNLSRKSKGFQHYFMFVVLLKNLTLFRDRSFSTLRLFVKFHKPTFVIKKINTINVVDHLSFATEYLPWKWSQYLVQQYWTFKELSHQRGLVSQRKPVISH